MSDQDASQQPGRPGPPEAPDPVARALAEVQEAMSAARAAEPPAVDAPTVPSEDEVAGLERAHEVLRTTLDRAEKGT